MYEIEGYKKGVRAMENIDETVDAICKWIQRNLESPKCTEDSTILPEMTNALAALITAKAQSY